MKPFAPIAIGAAASLLLAADATALASTRLPQPSTLHLVCAGGPDEPVCRALAMALIETGAVSVVEFHDHANAAPVDRGLTVGFVTERRTDDSLSGHLVWRTAGGTGQTGPTLELSVMDSGLTPDALVTFAGELIRHSNLPL